MASRWSQLNHLFSAYTISSKNFIVMELCDGMDLGRYMRQLQNVYGVQVEEFQAILLGELSVWWLFAWCLFGHFWISLANNNRGK